MKANKQTNKRNQKETNTGEARSRDYVYPHRWSDGTKMAGIARKVGPKDSRFLRRFLYFPCVRVFCCFFLPGKHRVPLPTRAFSSFFFAAYRVAWSGTNEREGRESVLLPNSNIHRRSKFYVYRFFLFFAISSPVSRNSEQREYFRVLRVCKKTGRFGPIGPETAQCQLPHRVSSCLVWFA